MRLPKGTSRVVSSIEFRIFRSLKNARRASKLAVLPVYTRYERVFLPKKVPVYTTNHPGDLERAFGRLNWMEAYTVGWTPTRALCYAAILVEMCEEFREEVWIKRLLGRGRSDGEGSSKNLENVARPLKA